ncbi:putative reverse transcriptase, RNA-dependent DNA polymerase, LTR copia-type gag-polypeptide [Tanacetum coccineum]
MTSSLPETISPKFKKQLDDEFSIKDLGILKYFLGIEVTKTTDGLVLSQRKYTLDILENSKKMGCKPSAFPIKQGLKLDKGESESRVNASQYRPLIGRLLYLQATRPDITYFVNILSQFVTDPRNNHLEAVNRVLGYLKATPSQGILLSRAGDPVLTAYCDSDCSSSIPADNVPADSSSSIPADYVSAGHVLVSADRDRIC